MAEVLHLWNEWEIQILVLFSFALQVLQLIFAGMLRRSISGALRGLLWLMYVLAELTATYALGQLSCLSMGSKPGGPQQQLMAFWAPFLLVHLGGQDTITAYAMEDNQLWRRHLLTFAVQAMAAAYVLYKNVGNHGPLVVPAVLMFLVGVLKNGEKIWALSFSRLKMIRKFLDGVSIKQKEGPYSAPAQDVEGRGLDDAEFVLQGAHDMLYICMGQFVDDKIWPSKFQNEALQLFHQNRRTFKLIEMQLSLMYDIFYTKAWVIHTWYGCCTRAISLLGTVMAFVLFQFSTGKYGYNRVDVVVTYTLIIGACILETASVLRAMGSTWTCATLKLRKWGWLHSLHLSLRRYFRVGQTRRWPGSIGQIKLLDSYTAGNAGNRCSNMISSWRNAGSMIPTGAMKLVLEEISRMAEACNGMEDMMRSYRGHCALNPPDRFLADLDLSWSLDMEFDQSILVWHLATDKFLMCSKPAFQGELVEATKAVSNYMMFLLVERPYMLPSPVRPTLHLKARKELRASHNWITSKDSNINVNAEDQPIVSRSARIARQLLSKGSNMAQADRLKLLRVVFGVWVEMLSYAAHHCSRESHARQLNSGGEFTTAVWLLTTAEFNRVNYSESLFKKREHGTFWNFIDFVDFSEFIEYLLNCIKWSIGILCLFLCCCWDVLLAVLLNLKH